MPVGTLTEIKKKYDLHDESYFYYTVNESNAVILKKVSEAELLAEESLKEVYENEPEGLWEKCLDNKTT